MVFLKSGLILHYQSFYNKMPFSWSDFGGEEDYEEDEVSEEEENESSGEEDLQGYTDDNKLWLKPSKRKKVNSRTFHIFLVSGQIVFICMLD